MEDTHVWMINADGTNRREVGTVDNRQGAPAWSPDGQYLFFTVQEHGNRSLYRVGAQSGKPEVVLQERGLIRSFALGSDKNVVYVFHSPIDLAQVYWFDGTSSRRLTDSNQELLSQREIAETVVIDYLSFDGMPVQAYLTLPLSRGHGWRNPLIAMIKGGPHGQRGAEFNHKAQVYSSQGWAILQVNYRGSSGYGQAFADAIFGDQNGGEAKDVLFGVQAALRRYDFLDPERLGVEGGSYGGQLTNWLVTQTRIFNAAIPIASISNLVSFNYMAYYHDYLAVEFGSYPHQNNLMDLLWERSPLRYVAQVSTPVMLVHGENDNDVPIAEAEQFYIALKDVGVEAVMVRYPREGHGVREAGHKVDLIKRSIDWYERHFEFAAR